MSERKLFPVNLLVAGFRGVCTYVISILVLGTIGSLYFWRRRARGTVKIYGLERYHEEIKAGRLIVACNHPTILESMLLLFMCWPRCLWQPCAFFPWSMPDATLFYKMGIPEPLARLLYWTSNSIPVSRTTGAENRQAIAKAIEKLKQGRTVIVHPEAGRTGSLPDGRRLLTPFIHNTEGTRQVRNFITLSRVPELACEAEARILPVYVDVPFWQTHDTFGKAWRAWSTGKQVISIHVGEAYTPDCTQPRARQNSVLAKKIVTA